ncbi:MAG: hypothetical protein QG657_2782, partial [Acidobacteriota bacterium]|nr:hypothetical protein [Acidobacteriota bacterium]
MSSNEKLTVSIGNKNKGNISVGGDIKVEINPNKYTPEFFTPPFNDYEESIYIIPISAPSLVEMTMREKFLVLGGDGYDKTGLARYIAWKILIENQNNKNTIEVNEWTNTVNPQNFISELQKKDKSTIFILPDISPHHIRHNLSGLYRVTQDNDHYLIITTDDTLEKWKVEKDAKQLFWLPSDPLYESENLLRVLLKRLTDKFQELPEELRVIELKPNSILMENLPLQEIAIKLKTPESIDTFVKGLTSLKSPIKNEDIRELLDASQNDRLAMKRWFFGSLSARERLITLGLCLFDGFSDDQFFAAMEELFEQSWSKRNPSMEALDYCDLDSLSNYYKFIEFQQEKNTKKVKSVLVNQQKTLLEISWDSHRRQILSALPVMENLVKESVLTGYLNPELYGTKERQSRLREIIGETFCTLGLISMDSIEDTLLRLAAKKELEVQVVVARAMAQWRDYGHDKELFDTLHSWEFKVTYRQIMASFLDNKETESNEQKNPLVYIKATIALTVGFSATYDSPNQLNDKLIDLFKKLADDTENSFIYSRF